MDRLIVLKDLRKVYARGSQPVIALDKVNLTVKKGTLTAVMGPSGCGKSTLVNLLGGLDRPSSGEIWINEEPAHLFPDAEWTVRRRRQIGIVFQFFNLLPLLSALENVALPLLLRGDAPNEARIKAEETLHLVGLSGRMEYLPHTLSGGEMQRVAIARAWAISPQLLLADEPTGNLDSKIGEEILTLLSKGVRETGMTAILVTHSPVAARHADTVVRLRDGQVERVEGSQTEASQAEASQ
jgi:putative ABC transport system ATP-binding protein